MPGEDGAAVIAEIEAYALPAMQKVNAGAEIRIIIETAVPPLVDRNAAPAVEFVSTDCGVVSFGTDAGYFSNADFPTVVFALATSAVPTSQMNSSNSASWHKGSSS